MSCALLLVLLALPAATQGVAGVWNASITNDLGTMPLVIELSVEGSKLNGSFSNHFMPKIPIQQGRVDGNRISFTLLLASVTLDYRGVIDGDKLTLTHEVSADRGGAGPSFGGALRAVPVLTATRAP
jgi:hypothetical protein